ncbi:MAG: phosphate transporter permease protein, partial [Bacilli bacterium]|nr:phosphate transporter permease protein [Bacilli bacterium]
MPSWFAFASRKIIVNRSMAGLFTLSAILVSVIIFSLVLFVGLQGLQVFKTVNPIQFFLSSKWNPEHGQYGVLPFIVGTVVVTVLSLIFALPFALGGAIFTAKIAPRRIREILRPAIDLFVGIPSVVYGMIGMTILVPFLGQHYGNGGYGYLATSLVLAIMIMPTILTVSEDAIRTLPRSLEEASLALGATRWQTIFKVLVPAAVPGILTGVILGTGRAIGETMAMVMVIGQAPKIPGSLIESSSSLTSEIVKEIGYAQPGTFYNALYMMAFLLLLLSIGLILVIRIVARR